MRAKTHKSIGFSLGIVAAVASYYFYPDMKLLNSLFAFIAFYFGSVAPDRLELWGLIPHRTFTHWFLLWLVFFGVCVYQAFVLHKQGWVIGTAFTAGALYHILWDLTNKRPLPFLVLFPRLATHSKWKNNPVYAANGFCLYWWESSEHNKKIRFLHYLIAIGLIYWIVPTEFWHDFAKNYDVILEAKINEIKANYQELDFSFVEIIKEVAATIWHFIKVIAAKVWEWILIAFDEVVAFFKE
ncbi:metal-dependent hydrolase [Psittacicella hinzii]|uniref:Metal-dependent hydrolase n=1 Tax=Psittacicella hinzii TaxID=2028575 RepID=A0A3A1YSF0_9GAMM|nr:metal-dependent hydrolase [Psittacicella hinzii]RIY39314.1 hypothetical protein CKF58_02415 [Psittacicella hinzii]